MPERLYGIATAYKSLEQRQDLKDAENGLLFGKEVTFYILKM